MDEVPMRPLLPLIPMGEDWDGVFRPINLLSYCTPPMPLPPDLLAELNRIKVPPPDDLMRGG